MAATATSVFFAQHLALFPAPLHVRKKSRKLIFRRLAQRRITHGRVFDDDPHGPLDDIIDEITVDIWGSSQENIFTAVSDRPIGLGEAFPWSVAPLPVSRIPSDQPLSVRKTRYSNSNSNSNSRSVESGSTVSEAMSSSHSRSSTDSDYECFGTTSSGPRSSASSSTRPAISTAELPHSAFFPQSLFDINDAATEQGLSTIPETPENSHEARPQPLSLRKRLFSLSNSMGKLRLKPNQNEAAHKTTSESKSTLNVAPQISAPASMTQEADEADDSVLPTTEAVAEWMSKYAKRTSVMTPLCAQVAKQFPSPDGLRYDTPEFRNTSSTLETSASLLTAAVRVLPEVKVLSNQEEQTFWVAIEVEGVAKSQPHLETAIDVVFVLDNSYYVTNDGLARALSLIAESLHHFEGSDRMALYTTHCTHEPVSGTVPDMWFPLSHVDKGSLEVVRKIISDIGALGTQTWRPPRPNPSIDDALTAVVKSLAGKNPKDGRTHVLFLTPIQRHIHDVVNSCSSIQFHMVNPGIMPFAKNPEIADTSDYVTTSNFTQYQSPSESVGQILRYARSKRPANRICNIHVDIRRRPGCDILRYDGSTDAPHLLLGQIHTFFAEVKVQRSQTQEMDLDSKDPVRDSVLARNNMKQDMLNAKALGASKVHLLSVQVMHQNTMLHSNEWIFTESPLVVIKDIGRLSRPTDRAMEVYKRRFFHNLVKLHPDAALVVADQLESIVKPELKEQAKKVLNHMRNEIKEHQEIMFYEQNSRQNLPSCPGPISVPLPHQFLVQKWEAQKKKRQGMLIT